MNPILSPLVGSAPTVTVIGLCKNAGKTTALCRLLRELEEEVIAVTSVGRDGERTDVVTGTEKPEIFVKKGTLFATAAGLLSLCDVTVEVADVTGVQTPLGQVAVLRALSDGYVQLAGPSAVGQLKPLEEKFRALGARRVLIDGAAGRKSLAAAGEGCALLCVGASMEGGLQNIVAETAHVCALFHAEEIRLEHGGESFALFDKEGERLPLELGEDGLPQWGKLPKEEFTLWTAGGVTSPMVRALARRGIPFTVAAPDATHFLFDREPARLAEFCGGKWAVEKKLKIAAVCANPWSACGNHLDKNEMLDALREAVEIPVVNVKEGWM